MNRLTSGKPGSRRSTIWLVSKDAGSNVAATRATSPVLGAQVPGGGGSGLLLP